MQYKLYSIFYQTLTFFGNKKGIKIIIPVNIGASIALFLFTLVLLITKLAGFDLQIIKSGNLLLIFLLICSVFSLVYFFIHEKKAVELRKNEDHGNRSLLNFFLYALVTVVIPILIMLHYRIGIK